MLLQFIMCEVTTCQADKCYTYILDVSRTDWQLLLMSFNDKSIIYSEIWSLVGVRLRSLDIF